MKGVIFMKIYKTINEMNLESKKCQELLKDYPVNNDMEVMAIKVLTTISPNVWLIPGLLDFTNDEFDELSALITKIRKDIGLD
jgi:hypothetical protein